MVAPLFVLLGFLPRVGQGFRLAALALFILGTVGSYVAIESGEASARVISFSPEARETLEVHEELAERTALLFLILTIIYAMILLLPLVARWFFRKTLPQSMSIVLSIVFLAIAGLCMNVLANAAHLGGRLVYVHRVENWILGQ